MKPPSVTTHHTGVLYGKSILHANQKQIISIQYGRYTSAIADHALPYDMLANYQVKDSSLLNYSASAIQNGRADELQTKYYMVQKQPYTYLAATDEGAIQFWFRDRLYVTDKDGQPKLEKPSNRLTFGLGAKCDEIGIRFYSWIVDSHLMPACRLRRGQPQFLTTDQGWRSALEVADFSRRGVNLSDLDIVVGHAGNSVVVKQYASGRLVSVATKGMVAKARNGYANPRGEFVSWNRCEGTIFLNGFLIESRNAHQIIGRTRDSWQFVHINFCGHMGSIDIANALKNSAFAAIADWQLSSEEIADYDEPTGAVAAKLKRVNGCIVDSAQSTGACLAQYVISPLGTIAGTLPVYTDASNSAKDWVVFVAGGPFLPNFLLQQSETNVFNRINSERREGVELFRSANAQLAQQWVGPDLDLVREKNHLSADVADVVTAANVNAMLSHVRGRGVLADHIFLAGHSAGASTLPAIMPRIMRENFAGLILVEPSAGGVHRRAALNMPHWLLALAVQDARGKWGAQRQYQLANRVAWALDPQLGKITPQRLQANAQNMPRSLGICTLRGTTGDVVSKEDFDRFFYAMRTSRPDIRFRNVIVQDGTHDSIVGQISHCLPPNWTGL